MKKKFKHPIFGNITTRLGLQLEPLRIYNKNDLLEAIKSGKLKNTYNIGKCSVEEAKEICGYIEPEPAVPQKTIDRYISFLLRHGYKIEKN